MALKRGDLVRWIIDHEIYESDGDILRGVKPNFRYGIIMEVSKKDSNAVIVCCCDRNKEGGWLISNSS